MYVAKSISSVGAVLVLILASVAAQAPPAGIQPYKPVVPTYNGTLTTQFYNGGSQQVTFGSEDAALLLGPVFSSLTGKYLQELYSDGSPAVISTGRDLVPFVTPVDGCTYGHMLYGKSETCH